MWEVRRQVLWAMPLLLALAVSIDGFTVGFACGLRRLAIPFSSVLAISSLSAATVAVSMLIGSRAALLIRLRSISAFGGVLLIIFGFYVIGQHLTGIPARPEQGDSPAGAGAPRKGLLTLLSSPEEADLDRSGTLSIKEALLLGAALAADAFAAGFGAALIGLSFLPTVLAVGLAKSVLLPLGSVLGRKALRRVAVPHAPLWGGAILIIIGIMNLF